jgi:esterase/lipase
MRSYHTIRQLAEQLAAAGRHVLRFDWSGHGDSQGSPREATVKTWLANIEVALKELQNISGEKVIAIAGLRFGATLAWRAAMTKSNIEDIVLWDATYSGKAYLQELQELHADFLKRTSSCAKGLSNENEFLGFAYSKELQQEIASLDISVHEIPKRCAVHSFASTPNTWADGNLWDHVILGNPAIGPIVACMNKEPS